MPSGINLYEVCMAAYAKCAAYNECCVHYIKLSLQRHIAVTISMLGTLIRPKHCSGNPFYQNIIVFNFKDKLV